MDYNSIRRKTKQITVGRVKIGGDAPVSVQSMTNTDTLDFEATLSQVTALEKAGCDIVRLAVPKIEAAKTIYRLKEAGVGIPLVADIHFDYKIALECVECGADKIRINPGNIGSDERVRAVANACASKNVPIRVGVNSGSLNKEVLAKYGSPTPEALAESAMTHVKLLQKFDFDDICIAIKSSSPSFMIAANRAVAALTDHPIHIGVTEAGTPKIGMMRSAVGIGSLLCDGIGDTLRVSLTADPVHEVEAGRDLLAAVGIAYVGGVNIVSCPTCGRTKLDLIGIANELERRCKNGDTHPSRPVTAAVMGCAVNGPGEASEADVGIAGGVGEALLFKKGIICGKVSEGDAVDALINAINEL